MGGLMLRYEMVPDGAAEAIEIVVVELAVV